MKHLVECLLLSSVLAVTSAGYLAPAKAVDYYSHPRYEFNYGVNDPHTGDQKSQSESRDGDVVKGQYSLVEPDGSVRTVHYTADSVNGFNAVVSKSGPGVHPPPELKHHNNVHNHHHHAAIVAAPSAVVAAPVAVHKPYLPVRKAFVKPIVVNHQQPLFTSAIIKPVVAPAVYSSPIHHHDYVATHYTPVQKVKYVKNYQYQPSYYDSYDRYDSHVDYAIPAANHHSYDYATY